MNSFEQDENDREFISKIKRLIPNEEDRILLFITIIGARGTLVEHISITQEIGNLPIMSRYACSLIVSSILAFISDGKKCEFKKIVNTKYEMGEQTQERIYRTMKRIIFDLYESLKEDEQI